MNGTNWSSRILRTAAVLALIQGLAHGMLHIRYVPNHGPLEQALVANMREASFSFGSFQRTYWGFYFGYGLMVVVTCLVQAVALWLLAGLAKSWPKKVAPMIGLYCVAYVVHAVLAWHYFFAKPVVFDVLIAVALGVAMSIAWKDKALA